MPGLYLVHTSYYSRLEKPTIPLATQERLPRIYYMQYLSLRIRTTDASQLEKRNKEQIRRERKGKKREESEKRKRKRKRKKKKRQEKQEKARRQEEGARKGKETYNLLSLARSPHEACGVNAELRSDSLQHTSAVGRGSPTGCMSFSSQETDQ